MFPLSSGSRSGTSGYRSTEKSSSPFYSGSASHSAYNDSSVWSQKGAKKSGKVLTITGNSLWSDIQHQKEKIKTPKYRPGRKLIAPTRKYYGHNPGDIWSRGVVDYDACDALDCGCAPRDDDDDDLPCVVNDTCLNCPKVPTQPRTRKKRSCSYLENPIIDRPRSRPQETKSKPFVPRTVPSRPLVKQVPSKPLPRPVASRPLPRPVTSRPLPRPVVSRPLPRTVTSKPFSRPVVSRPTPKPVVSRPLPTPIVSRPKLTPSRPLPQQTSSRPLSKTKPVTSSSKLVKNKPLSKDAVSKKPKGKVLPASATNSKIKKTAGKPNSSYGSSGTDEYGSDDHSGFGTSEGSTGYYESSDNSKPQKNTEKDQISQPKSLQPKTSTPKRDSLKKDEAVTTLSPMTASTQEPQNAADIYSDMKPPPTQEVSTLAMLNSGSPTMATITNHDEQVPDEAAPTMANEPSKPLETSNDEDIKVEEGVMVGTPVEATETFEVRRASLRSKSPSIKEEQPRLMGSEDFDTTVVGETGVAVADSSPVTMTLNVPADPVDNPAPFNDAVTFTTGMDKKPEVDARVDETKAIGIQATQGKEAVVSTLMNPGVELLDSELPEQKDTMVDVATTANMYLPKN